MSKFFIATIEARKSIRETLELVTTDIWSMSVADLNVYKIKADGVLATEVFAPVTLLNNDYEYYIDYETNILTTKIAGGLIGGLVSIIMTHVIAVTSDKDMYWHIDPDNYNTKKILYRGGLDGKKLSSAQTQSNNLVGILTTSISSFSIINTSQFYNRYVIDNFKSSKIKIWKCETTPFNRNTFYTGYVSRVNMGANFIISVNDFLRKLENKLFSNGTYQDSISKSITSGPLATSDEVPIARINGRASSFKWRYRNLLSGSYSVIEPIPSSMPEAICSDYDTTISTSTNRDWVTGILNDASGALENYTVADSGIVDATTAFIELVSGSEQFTLLDSFTANTMTGYSAKIKGYSAPQFIITDNVVNLPTIGNIISIHKVSLLVLEMDGDTFILHYGVHYTVGTIVANQPIPITLANNFEASVGAPRALDPAKDKLYYKIRNIANRDSYKHGNQIKNILLSEFDVSEINEDSFDDANTALALNLCYQTPSVGDSFVTKMEMIQRLLSSSMGYLYLDEDFKISYGNFTKSDESDSSEETDDIEIEEKTMNHFVDFEDLYSSVVFENNQFGDSPKGTSIEIFDKDAKYLNEYENSTSIIFLGEVFELVALEDIIENHLKRCASFFTRSKVQTSVSLLENYPNIGDKIKISSIKQANYPNATVTATSKTIIKEDLTLASLGEIDGEASVSFNGYAPEVI